MTPDVQINQYLFCILEFSLNFQSQELEKKRAAAAGVAGTVNFVTHL